ncbi:MAG: DUF1826 domain-containing protein [Pseudomonadota bacterium]
MNLAHAFVDDPRIGSTDEPEGLFAIRRSDRAAIVWSREPLAQFQAWLDAVAPTRLPKARILLDAAKVQGALSHICDLCETPVCAERSMLIDDIAALADIVARIFRSPYVQLQLDANVPKIARIPCSDGSDSRLICTYRGTTATFVHADQDAVAPRSVAVHTGAAILLRGPGWQAQPVRNDLHTGSAPQSTGSSQLVLTLTPVTDANPKPDRTNLH